MKKDNAEKAPEVFEGHQIAAEDITLPNGEKVTVRVLDCRRERKPKVPKAKWGTPEFADELEYFEAPEELRARVYKVLGQPVADVIDFLQTADTKGQALAFWVNAAKANPGMLTLATKVALMNAQMLLDVIGTDILAALEELIALNLKDAWSKKAAKKPAKKPAKSPAAKEA